MWLIQRERVAIFYRAIFLYSCYLYYLLYHIRLGLKPQFCYKSFWCKVHRYATYFTTSVKRKLISWMWTSGETEFAEIRQIWNSTKFGSQITPNCLNAHGIDRMWGTVQVWCKLEIRRFEFWVSCAEPFLLGSLVAAHKKLCTPCSRLCNNDCNTVVFQLQVLYKKQ